jgi:hypothetical protein
MTSPASWTTLTPGRCHPAVRGRRDEGHPPSGLRVSLQVESSSAVVSGHERRPSCAGRPVTPTMPASNPSYDPLVIPRGAAVDDEEPFPLVENVSMSRMWNEGDVERDQAMTDNGKRVGKQGVPSRTD